MYAKNNNGTVNSYSILPQRYIINYVSYDLNKMNVQVQEEQGFFTVQLATLGVNEVAEPLLPSDFDGTKFVQRKRTLTQQEIDDAQAESEYNSREAVVNQREIDGLEFFKKVRNFVYEKYEDGTLTEARYRQIRRSLVPALKPLKDGDWDISQDELDDLAPSVPPWADILYDFIKNKVDQYILDNY